MKVLVDDLIDFEEVGLLPTYLPFEVGKVEVEVNKDLNKVVIASLAISSYLFKRSIVNYYFAVLDKIVVTYIVNLL